MQTQIKLFMAEYIYCTLMQARLHSYLKQKGSRKDGRHATFPFARCVVSRKYPSWVVLGKPSGKSEQIVWCLILWKKMISCTLLNGEDLVPTWTTSFERVCHVTASNRVWWHVVMPHVKLDATSLALCSVTLAYTSIKLRPMPHQLPHVRSEQLGTTCHTPKDFIVVKK